MKSSEGNRPSNLGGLETPIRNFIFLPVETTIRLKLNKSITIPDPRKQGPEVT